MVLEIQVRSQAKGLQEAGESSCKEVSIKAGGVETGAALSIKDQTQHATPH
jgi:hypothetical protein